MPRREPQFTRAVGLAAGAVAEHPGVFAATTLRRVHDEGALLERDAGEAAREHPHVAPEERVGAEVDVPPLELVADEGGHAREADDGLRDVVATVLEDLRAGGLELGFARLGADHDAVAAGLVHWLHDHLGEVLEHVVALLAVLAREGGNVRQDGIFAEVILNHFRHVRVDGLVVGDAVPGRVGEADAALFEDLEEAGHAEEAVFPERLRIEEHVVDPTVNDVDPFVTAGGTHAHYTLVDDQIATLDELDPHLLRQERMLEVGRVVGAGREERDDRLGRRRQMPERAQEPRRILVDRLHTRGGEHVRERALHEAPVLEHVAHAGRTAQVVLQHVELPVAIAHEVGADDVAEDALRRRDAVALRQVALRREHERLRDHAVAQDFPLPVHVADERVERQNPLPKPALDRRKIGLRDHARHDVEREDALGAPLRAVHVERDPTLEEIALGDPLLLSEILGREPREHFGERRCPRTRLVRAGEHLVVEVTRVVGSEVHVPPSSPSVRFPVGFARADLVCDRRERHPWRRREGGAHHSAARSRSRSRSRSDEARPWVRRRTA